MNRTTNADGSLDSTHSKGVRLPSHAPNEEAATKRLHPASPEASHSWRPRGSRNIAK